MAYVRYNSPWEGKGDEIGRRGGRRIKKKRKVQNAKKHNRIFSRYN
jgi:hypothetical protein